MRTSPVKLRYPLFTLIVFIIYAFVTYHHGPQVIVSKCPGHHQCECIDNSCRAMVVEL